MNTQNLSNLIINTLSEEQYKRLSADEVDDYELYLTPDISAGEKTSAGGEIFNDYNHNQATGQYSHAEGERTVATGRGSHAEGYRDMRSTNATGAYSHSEGFDTLASGTNAHAEGNYTEASGHDSHAEGYSTVASGNMSHAEGSFSNASGVYSHAEGLDTIAGARVFNVINTGTVMNKQLQTIIPGAPLLPVVRVQLDPTIDPSQLTMGDVCGVYYGDDNDGHWQMIGLVVNCDANKGVIILVNYDPLTDENGLALMPKYFFACGNPNPPNLASMGINLTIPAQPFAPKLGNISIGDSSTAKGENSFTVGKAAHAEGSSSAAVGNFSHAEGRYAQAIGKISHAQGLNTLAWGEGSDASGIDTKAYGRGSVAEGIQTTAGKPGDSTIDNPAHAEGKTTQALGYASHAEGNHTEARGEGSHAEGVSTIAGADTAIAAHAEGFNTVASNSGSHAEGEGTDASGKNSHAAGYYTRAVADAQTVAGRFNIGNDLTLFEIGNGGTSENPYYADITEIIRATGDYSALEYDADGYAYYQGYPVYGIVRLGNNGYTGSSFRITKDTTTAAIGGGVKFYLDEVTQRRNAFEVYFDGHAEAQTVNENKPKSLVTLEYFQERVGNIMFVGNSTELAKKYGTNIPDNLVWIDTTGL